jgi:predicted DNA-binding transcriptional regulator YafY
MSQRQQLERVFEIDRRIRAGLYPSADGMAQELEVSRRVIFNDRQFLLDRLGAPLAYDRSHGGWYYTDETWVLPTAVVTRGELLVFLIGVEAATRQLGPALEEELRAAVAKIAGGLRGKVEVDFEALRRHWTFAAPPSMAASERVLLMLHEAIERQRVVAMSYFTASRGEQSQRRVEPHHLHNSGGDWLLFAFDQARRKMLTFNAGRIADLKLSPETFARQPDFSPQAFLQSGFRAESGPQVFEVVVRFDVVQAIYIRERRWHETQTLEELPGGGLMLRFRAGGLGEIARWILGYGAHAEVLSPPELRQAVAQAARETARLYEENRQ